MFFHSTNHWHVVRCALSGVKGCVGEVDGLPGHGRLGRRGLAQGCASRVDGPEDWAAPHLGIDALVRPWRVVSVVA